MLEDLLWVFGLAGEAAEMSGLSRSDWPRSFGHLPVQITGQEAVNS